MIVATWNVENLFRPGTEGGPSDERAYEAKLTALAAVIEAMAPDVLALQEVGQPEALDDLLERSARSPSACRRSRRRTTARPRARWDEGRCGSA